MGKGEFTFRNDTGEKITLKHAFKNVTGKTYSVENHGYRTLEVNLDSQTFEKYLLCDSADAFTGKYVSSDDYKNSEEVKIVKQGDKFVLNFQPRYKLTFLATWNKMNIKLPMHSYGRSIRICPRGLDFMIVLTSR